jgi:hypothetical protein
MEENIMNTKSSTTDTSTAADTAPASQSLSNKQRIINLAIGDTLVFLIFATIGIRSHDEALSVPKVLITAVPFIAAWFLVSPFIGAFRRGLELQPGKMVQRTLLAWLASWPIALLFRSLLEYLDGTTVGWKVPPLSFALVALITNTLFFLIWRWPFAIVNRQRTKRQ